MDHTATPMATTDVDDTAGLGSVANPRRTRVGADGHPISRPAATND